MKKVLLNILLAVILATFVTVLVGCHGVGQTSAERSLDIHRSVRLNGSEMIDDIDSVFYDKEPSRLSEQTVR